MIGSTVLFTLVFSVTIEAIGDKISLLHKLIAEVDAGVLFLKLKNN